MAAVARVGIELTTKKAVSELKKLDAAVGKAQKGLGDIGAESSVAGKGFTLFGNGAAAAGVGVKGLGAAVGAALGPITAAVAAVASLGTVFQVLREQDFAEKKFESLGGNSDALRASLKEVSRELSGQASVVELTAAAYDVASAGFSNAADASEILKAASLGATGGFSDINTVGDATTSVLNAYGKSASEAGKLVDGFIQTQNDGKIVIGEYAANIAKVAPVAAALGVPLEEVNAAVAQITAGGQGAEVTFTALKTAFAQVAAGKVGKEFEKFGVEISAATLKSDGLAGTLQKIEQSGADAGTVIKAFGTEAGPSILALLNDTEKYNELLENQKEAQGAAAAAAFTAADTIDGQLKRLTTSFQNVFADQSELGELIKNTFTVAAVTVETLDAALGLVLAPTRALLAAIQEIGGAIASAIGLDGVNAAFELEQGFQFVLGVLEDVSNFFIGLGKLIGQEIGTRVKQAIDGTKAVRDGIVNAFSGVFEKVAGFINKAYNLIPEPIRKLLEGKLQEIAAGVSTFVGDTIDLGSGAGTTSGTSGTGSTKDKSSASSSSTTGSGKTEKDRLPALQAEVALQERLLAIEKEIAQAVLAGDAVKQETLEKEKISEIAASEINKIKQEGLSADVQAAEIRLVQLDEEQKLLDIDTKSAKAKQDKAAKVAEIINGLEQEAGLLQAQLDGTEEEFALKQKIAELTKGLSEDEAKRVTDLVNGVEALKKQKAEAEKLQAIYDQIGSTIASGVVDALGSAVDQTKSLADVAADTLRSIANILLELGVNTALSSTGLSIFKNLPGFADGGSPPVGQPSIVGERGPELFVPTTSGTIVPNGEFGMGGSTNVVVNVDASGSSASGAGSGKELGSAIGAAVQAELIKQKRPGGLLA